MLDSTASLQRLVQLSSSFRQCPRDCHIHGHGKASSSPSNVISLTVLLSGPCGHPDFILKTHPTPFDIGDTTCCSLRKPLAPRQRLGRDLMSAKYRIPQAEEAGALPSDFSMPSALCSLREHGPDTYLVPKKSCI